MLSFDSIIVGAGISGVTASIYLKRANKNILLLDKEMIGGQLNKISIIENYPGFTKVDGATLSNNLYEQVKNLNIDYRQECVLNIKKEELFIITTNKNTYKSKTVILATGRTPRKLNIEKEEKLIGSGVSYCAHCDGFFFKGKEVAVIGGGNSALEEALFLSEICTKVYIIHRRDTFSGEKILQEKIKKKSNIIIKYNSEVVTLNECDNKLSNVIIKTKDKYETINIDGIFIYIGSIPSTYFLKDLELEQNKGYILVDSKMRTNIDGLYACGDSIEKDIYQLSTAIGESTIAAISVINKLKN